MRCPQCGFDNPPGTKFCGRCGSKLGIPCPACGTPNPEHFTFCGTCGARLTSVPGHLAPPATEERKVVTILFADVTGSTTIAERIDPERMRTMMARFFEAMAEVIHRFGGTVEKFIGDEVMAVFGIPAAHEDDPERAARAALAMHGRLRELNANLQKSHGITFQMRVGINTGEVVANPRAAEKGEFMVTGDAVNIAARLRSAAAPGTTVIGERTYLETAWLAEYRTAGPLTLKGKSEPVQAWELVSLLPEPVRPATRGFHARMIGRDGEFALLQGFLQRVIRERKTHLISILGPPGTGKTRLVQELRRSLPSSMLVHQGRCLAYGSTSLWAVGEIVRADCGILRSDPLPAVADKLKRRIASLMGDETGEGRQIIAHLASVLAVRGLEVEASPEGSREELFWALRRYFERLAGQAPLALVFEDLHWGDTELLEFIEYLAQWSAGGPILILCLARPELLEARPGWGGGKRNYTSLFLEPLSSDDTQRLLQELLQTDAVPDAVAKAVAIAEGNPLFVEEILRMFLDSGGLRRTDGRWEIVGALTPSIPPTIQGVITARLDRLGSEEKSILQEAAILGTRFRTGALAHAIGGEESRLAPVLHSMQAKDFLVEQEGSQVAGQREFMFRSTMIRDVAYGMLPKSRRSEKHRAYGVWLEQTYRDRAEEFADLLAHHWLQAARLANEIGHSDLWKEAAPNAMRYSLMAGQKAARVYANEQAVTHYQNARELADALGADAERVAAIEGLAEVHALQAQWEEASRLYQEALEYHTRKGNAVQQARVQSRIGSTFSGVFDFRQALPHIKAAMEKLQSEQEETELAGVYIQMARTQTAIGHFKEAEDYARQGLQLAERHGLQHQIAEGEWALGFISTLLGRPDAVGHYERCIEIARKVGDLGWVVQGFAWKAFRHRWLAEYAHALDAYTQALTTANETNNRSRIAFCHIGMGETYFLAGNWAAAAESWRMYLTMAAEVPAWVEHARAMLAFMQGNLTEALGWAEKFIEHAERRRELTSIVLAVERCAFLYVRSDRHADASRLLTGALEQFTPMGVIWPAFYHPLAAEAALMLQDLQKASAHCDKAATYRPLELKPAVARLHRARGLIDAAQRKWEEAANNLTQTAAIYQEIGQPYDRALSLEALADVYERRASAGDRDHAAQLRAEAVKIYQQLGAAFEVRRLQESHPPQ